MPVCLCLDVLGSQEMGRFAEGAASVCFKVESNPSISCNAWV